MIDSNRYAVLVEFKTIFLSNEARGVARIPFARRIRATEKPAPGPEGHAAVIGCRTTA